MEKDLGLVEEGLEVIVEGAADRVAGEESFFVVAFPDNDRISRVVTCFLCRSPSSCPTISPAIPSPAAKALETLAIEGW